MEMSSYITIIIISLGFIAMPGPNVLVVISTSLSEGKAKAFRTIAGVTIAMLLQLVIATFSTAWLVNTLSQGFLWLKWFGVIYLIYLGIMNIRSLFDPATKAAKNSSMVLFSRGFFVSLTNPKTIIFFSAFLPQFVSQQGSPFGVQMAVLSITFLLLALSVNIIYAISASKIASSVSSGITQKVSRGASGALYIGAGLLLAATNRD